MKSKIPYKIVFRLKCQNLVEKCENQNLLTEYSGMRHEEGAESCQPRPMIRIGMFERW